MEDSSSNDEEEDDFGDDDDDEDDEEDGDEEEDDSDSDSEEENQGDEVDDSKPRRTLELNGAKTRGPKGIVYTPKEEVITEVSVAPMFDLFYDIHRIEGSAPR